MLNLRIFSIFSYCEFHTLKKNSTDYYSPIASDSKLSAFKKIARTAEFLCELENVTFRRFYDPNRSNRSIYSITELAK